MTRKQNCVLPTEENWTLQSHDFNTLEEFMKKLNNNWWMKIYITSYCHDICVLGEQCCAAQSKQYTTLGKKFPLTTSGISVRNTFKWLNKKRDDGRKTHLCGSCFELEQFVCADEVFLG
jgi:hypothetical protein